MCVFKYPGMQVGIGVLARKYTQLSFFNVVSYFETGFLIVLMFSYCTRIVRIYHCASFYKLGSGELNSAPKAYTVNFLLIELLPQPMKCLFLITRFVYFDSFKGKAMTNRKSLFIALSENAF